MNTLNKLLLGIIGLLLLVTGYAVAQYLNPATSSEENSEKEVSTDMLDDHEHNEQTHTHADEAAESTSNEGPSTVLKTSPLDSPYLGDYTIHDTEHGDETTVRLTATERIMTTNSLPNHETGDFPNSGNPNSISEIDNTYTFTLSPTYTGVATPVRTPGVGVNGISFEPGTAERATCATGEELALVGLQDFMNLGMDMNNAHVQPTGKYHYHGTPEGLVTAADSGSDLVHIGFAVDGHLIYHSKSNAYKSSYRLSTTPRTGADCTLTGPGNPKITLDNTMPDGTYEEDWVFNKDYGDLDECNGTFIDGQYVYLVTDEYPFISRCMMGEFTEETPPQGGPGVGGPGVDTQGGPAGARGPGGPGNGPR